MLRIFTYISTCLILSGILVNCSCSEDNPEEIKSLYSPNQPIEYQDPIADKIFFLLTQIKASDEISEIIANDFYFKKVNNKILETLEDKLSECNDLNACIDLLLFTASDISSIGGRFAQLAGENAEFNGFIDQYIRASGTYYLFEENGNDQFIRQIWIETANGVNNILSVYGKGEKPQYPDIDSISFDTSNKDYLDSIKSLLNESFQESDKSSLFFDLPLTFAIGLLKLNGRDEAARYEPLHREVNKACYDKLSDIEWNKFPFTFIMVPGDSPNSPGDSINLSEGGKHRLKRGVQLYRDSIAPILILSGGHVRPFQTPYSEAIEMKKYAILYLGVPEKHILVDPHARHTTTNFRNVSRLARRYKIPVDMPALVTSTESNIKYIESDKFRLRCLDELGYRPADLGPKYSEREIEFFPHLVSLTIDPMDPLDP
jgi:hypothetical protein